MWARRQIVFKTLNGAILLIRIGIGLKYVIDLIEKKRSWKTRVGLQERGKQKRQYPGKPRLQLHVL